jgi:hypothetical protein
MSLEQIIRPFQLPDVTLPRQQSLVTSGGTPSPVRLEIGKGGGGKTVSGSASVTQTFYMDKKVKEPRAPDGSSAPELTSNDVHAFARVMVIQRIRRDKDNKDQFVDVATNIGWVTKTGQGVTFQRDISSFNGLQVADPDDVSEPFIVRSHDDLRAAVDAFKAAHPE